MEPTYLPQARLTTNKLSAVQQQFTTIVDTLQPILALIRSEPIFSLYPVQQYARNATYVRDKATFSEQRTPFDSCG